MLYFGDSLKCDLYPSAVLAKWDVALILEEMETEGLVMLDCMGEQQVRYLRERTVGWVVMVKGVLIINISH